MINRLLAISLLFILAAGSTGAFAAGVCFPQSSADQKPESEPAAKPESNKSSAALRREFKSPWLIPAGERLVYEVKLSRFPLYVTLGEVTFEFLGLTSEPVINGIQAAFKPAADERLIHLRAAAVSKGLLTSLFGIDVNDRFEALVDPRDFSTALSFIETREGKRRTAQTAVFDHESQSIKYTLTDLNKPQEPAREKALPLESGMLDLLSAFYFVQLQKLKEGSTLRFPVNYTGQNYQFEIVIHQREKLRTELGQFRAIKIEPKLFGPGRLFTRSGEMFLWLTDDERHIPLRAVAKAGGNTITATLVKTEQRCRRAAQRR